MKYKLLRVLAQLRKGICGWAFGHIWVYEKEFMTCSRRYCHKSISGREWTALHLKGKTSC